MCARLWVGARLCYHPFSLRCHSRHCQRHVYIFALLLPQHCAVHMLHTSGHPVMKAILKWRGAWGTCAQYTAGVQTELWVKEGTVRNKLAGAIAGRVRDSEAICLLAKGATSVGNAMAAVCRARQFLEVLSPFKAKWCFRCCAS
jgi:hypothetical protein